MPELHKKYYLKHSYNNNKKNFSEKNLSVQIKEHAAMIVATIKTKENNI